MTRLVSNIYALGEPPRETPAERERRAEQARAEIWRRHGLAVFDPSDIADDWLRLAITHEAEKRYGRRGRC